ncbi:MAG: hypothetical protein BWX91_00197 [Spirochaetes bacterium ADurb.Bin133]|jgi:hypothetical protein|nr:MAG: hypothetical protein BWX91_00197 [Spirochaetes bacterium ADurb.Bin133]
MKFYKLFLFLIILLFAFQPAFVKESAFMDFFKINIENELRESPLNNFNILANIRITKLLKMFFLFLSSSIKHIITAISFIIVSKIFFNKILILYSLFLRSPPII